MKQHYFASAFGLSLALAAGAYAQTAPADDQVDSVDEVIVTGAPYAVSLDSATTHVDVLNTDAVLRTTPTGLGDVLDHIPGLRNSQHGPGAARPIIRGLSGPRVMLLQNGTGLVDVSALSADHAVVADPGMASRIEVLRGPSTLAYGGSAIGGVVNVIDDRIPSTPADDALDGYASGSWTSNGDGRAGSIFLKTGQGPFVFTLDGTRRDIDEYEAGSNPVSADYAAANGLTPLTDRHVPNSDLELNAYGAGLSFIGSRGFIGVSAKQTRSGYGVPYSADVSNSPPTKLTALNVDQTRYDLRGEASLEWPLFEKVRLSSGYTDYVHAEIDRLDPTATPTRFLSAGVEGRLEFIQREHDGVQGAVGFQGLNRTFAVVGGESFVPAVDIHEAGVFVLQRYDTGGWGVEGGLRVDQRTLHADLVGRPTPDAVAASVPGIDWSTAEATQKFETVSVSAGVFARPVEGLFLAFSASRNTRAPTEYELFSSGPHDATNSYAVGNPEITSETVTSGELTARYSAGRFRAEANVFHARYKGYIDEVPNGLFADDDGVIDPTGVELPVFVYVQGDAVFTGGEIEVRYAALQTPRGTLWLEGSMDTVRGDVDGVRPARVPPNGYTGRLVWEGSRLEGDVEVRTLAAQDRTAPFEPRTAGYTLVNMRVAYKVFEDKDITLFVEGTNLTDQEAREHTSFLKDVAPRPGRSIRTGFSARF